MDFSFLLVCSLVITGVYASTWDGMIFGHFRSKLDGLLPMWIQKPLYSCVICMASFWGGSLYLIFKGIDLNIITHIISLAGLNTLIAGIIFLAYERNTNQ